VIHLPVTLTIGTIIDEEFRIRNSGIVNYDLGDLGESGISSIIVNPKNFSVNRLIKTQYTYEPADNYVGKDYVEIEISIVNINNSTGNVQKKNYKIRITIIVTE